MHESKPRKSERSIREIHNYLWVLKYSLSQPQSQESENQQEQTSQKQTHNVSLFIVLMKHHEQKQREEGWLILSYHGPPLKAVRLGTQTAQGPGKRS